MFYEEMLIDSVLYSRDSPDGEWTPAFLEILTAKYLRLRREVETEAALDPFN
jgi:hypothetical protein